MTKLLKGNVSFTVFKPGKNVDDISKFREDLASNAFQRLDPFDMRDESCGWIDAKLSFDSENFDSLMHDNFFVFSLRLDKYAFSASQMRPYLEETEFVFKRENNLEYLNAHQKKELREQTIKHMKTNSYPKTTIVEVAWDLETQLIYLFTQSSTLIAKFIQHFEHTFGTTIDEISVLDSAKELGRAEKLEPIFSKIWGDEK
ncbi:recombination-associated protein RdgC [bacterium]|nr:recombination-associated protein RdgC [bacterium]